MTKKELKQILEVEQVTLSWMKRFSYGNETTIQTQQMLVWRLEDKLEAKI